MQPSIFIRDAKEDDLFDIKALAELSFSPYTPLIGREPAPIGADYLSHIRHDQVFLAHEGLGKPTLGFAVLVHRADGLWLESIAVHPQHQGRGIAKLLISHLEGQMGPEHDEYHLYTHVKMTKNIALYHHIGFREVARRTVDGFQRVYMSKATQVRPKV